MKFIIDNDKLEFEKEEEKVLNSATINYHIADVQYDSSWDNLTLELVIAKKKDITDAVSRLVIKDTVVIDVLKEGIYTLGFIGYTIENDVKIFQKVTNLIEVYYNPSAGEFEVNKEYIPSATEWEIYYQQMKALISEIQSNYNILENKPKINGVELIGDLTSEELGIKEYDDTEIRELLENKVDKEEGKGLSSNDFTNEEKHKLNELENYDDTEVRELIDNKVDKEEGKVLSSNDFTTEEKNKLADLKNYDDRDLINQINQVNELAEQNEKDITNLGNRTTAIEQEQLEQEETLNHLDDVKADKESIPDVSEFIKKTVNDLVNYYKKTETYTQTEINQLIGAIKTVSMKIVPERPATGENNIIYLVPSQKTEPENIYDEYIYVDNKWELIGTTAIDLSNVYTKEEIMQILFDYITSNDLEEILKGYVKSTDYAKDGKAGIVKTAPWANIKVDGNGVIYVGTKSFQVYEESENNLAINKGILENVISGKGLVSDTDYASSNKGGVFKTGNGVVISSGGYLTSPTRTYENYLSVDSGVFIGKGTLENVITGKGLVSDTDYATPNKGGVMRVNANFALWMNGGNLNTLEKTYEDYNNGSKFMFIGKGTLENVIAGKGLINQSQMEEYINSLNGEESVY